jgi:hypothetical protein
MRYVTAVDYSALRSLLTATKFKFLAHLMLNTLVAMQLMHAYDFHCVVSEYRLDTAYIL